MSILEYASLSLKIDIFGHQNNTAQ